MSFATAGMMGRPVPPATVTTPRQNFSRTDLLDYRQGNLAEQMQPHPFAQHPNPLQYAANERMMARTPASRRTLPADREMERIQQMYSGSPMKPIRSTVSSVGNVTARPVRVADKTKLGANVDMEAMSKKAAHEYFKNTKLSAGAAPAADDKVSVKVSKSIDNNAVSKQLAQLTQAIKELRTDVDAGKVSKKNLDRLEKSISKIETNQNEQAKVSEGLNKKIVSQGKKQQEVNTLVVEKMEQTKQDISSVKSKVGTKMNSNALKSLLSKTPEV